MAGVTGTAAAGGGSGGSLLQALRSRWPFLAALGAGCLVGASGIILAQRLSRRVDHLGGGGHEVSKELSSLYVSVRDLEEAVRELKEANSSANGKKPLKSALRTVTFADVEDSLLEKCISPSTSSRQLLQSSASSTTTEFFSAISSDEEEQEFFDLQDDEVDEEGRCQQQLVGGSDVILELFRQVDDLCVGNEDEQAKALLMLREQEMELSQNSEFLWRICKAIYLSASNSTDKQSLISEAVMYGARAIKCNDDCSEAHKWYAIAVGSRGEFMGIREKILDGFEFKRHVDKAAQLAPKDHTIQHLLGRFCFEVAELSWLERKMAGTLFVEPPVATMEEARDHFLAAEEIKPEGWKENRLYLAKTFLKLQEREIALKWLEMALEVPSKNFDDQQAHEEVVQLLEDCQNCRS